MTSALFRRQVPDMNVSMQDSLLLNKEKLYLKNQNNQYLLWNKGDGIKLASLNRKFATIGNWPRFQWQSEREVSLLRPVPQPGLQGQISKEVSLLAMIFAKYLWGSVMTYGMRKW